MVVHNPIMWTDLPDPDVIRVDDVYYMVSTTMYYMPGAPILKSRDLSHWEIVSYVFEQIEDNDQYNLLGAKNAYGKGQWATSLRYYKGMYYACFVCHDMSKTYLYYTKDIEKSNWKRYEFNRVFHDMSILFDGDRNYLIYNNGDIRITELNTELSEVKLNGIDQEIIQTPSEEMRLRCEGCRAYKINGYYYLLFIEWPIDGNGKGIRRQVCYRSKNLLGPYERKIILEDDMGFQGHGIAQGVIIDSPQGDWYSLLFQDYGSLGRIPYLLPVEWKDNWPMIGVCGKVPHEFVIPLEEHKTKELTTSDDFTYTSNDLNLCWEWNHNGHRDAWSVTERRGFLRLKNLRICDNIMEASNTLTQRTTGPQCSFKVMIDVSNIRVGDYVGLVALQRDYMMIGVKLTDEKERQLVVSKRSPDGLQYDEITMNFQQNNIYVGIEFDFENCIDQARAYYSYDGSSWFALGSTLSMKYSLELFTGYRIGLFCYATRSIGGFADFAKFQYCKELLR